MRRTRRRLTLKGMMERLGLSSSRPPEVVYEEGGAWIRERLRGGPVLVWVWYEEDEDE
jgi:hypothetical protein